MVMSKTFRERSASWESASQTLMRRIYQSQAVGDLSQENFPHGYPFCTLNLVRSITLQARFRLGTRQSMAKK
jgi:hypothetical protein